MKSTTENTKPDYQIAADELADFYRTLGLASKIHGGHLETDAEQWQHHAYRVEFSKWGITPQTFDWKAGTGIKDRPNPAEVLGACCRDYYDAQSTSFEDWASNYGYDTDSRKAESIFRKCQEIGTQLRALGLSQKQIETLAEFSNRL